MANKSSVIIIGGVSCAGKTKFSRMLIENHPERFDRPIGYTTRSPRIGEVDGVDYHFITQTQFQHMERRGKFYETSNANGVQYGGTMDEMNRIFKAGKIPVLVVDFNGIEAVCRNYPDTKILWIEITEDHFKRSLNNRGMPLAEIQRRIGWAEHELRWLAENKETYGVTVISNDWGQEGETYKKVESFALGIQ